MLNPIRKLFKKNPSPRKDSRSSRLASAFKSYGLKPVRDRLDLDYFTIVYCQNRYENISPFYLLYKYLHAVAMIVIFCFNVSHLEYFERDNMIRWHLYLNHWSTLVCVIEASCGVFVVSYFYHHSRTKAIRNAMEMSYSGLDRLMIYTYLNATAITFSTAASFLFWLFIFDDNYLSVGKIFEHGLTPVFMIFKLTIERIPFEIPFVLYPLILLICYFMTVAVTYYVVYKNGGPNNGKHLYILKHFNTERPMYFIWFTIKACLILAAIHVVLVALNVSKRAVIRLLCRKPRRRRRTTRDSPPGRSERSYTPPTRWSTWMSSTDQDLIPSPISKSTNPFRRMFDIIGYLETLHRQDFIHPEWRHYSADHPSGFYLVYRFLHMSLFVLCVLFSMLEVDKLNYDKHSVKYIILWIFYFSNFFLIISFLQSVFGFVVIYKAYRRDVTNLMYYEQSDSYVTGFQKSYSLLQSAATTLAIFSLVTSWQLVEDTGGTFTVLDYSYDSSHIINPLAMALDFLVVGHPFKFFYVPLPIGLLGLNVVFNYWLYNSKITSRSGKKFVYEYLNWDDTTRTALNVVILYFQLVFIHVILWIIFIFKRYYGVALNRRRVSGYQVNANVAPTAMPQSHNSKEPPTDKAQSAKLIVEPVVGTSQVKVINKVQSSKQHQHAGSDETVTTGGSYEGIGPPSIASINDTKHNQVSLKSILEKIKSNSLVKMLNSALSVRTTDTQPPMDHPAVDDSVLKSNNERKESPTGTKRSSSSNVTSPGTADQRTYSSDSMKTGETTLSPEFTPESVTNKVSSRQTSHSSRSTLPVITELDTNETQAASDPAKAETFTENKTPQTDTGRAVPDKNEPSSSKSTPPVKKSDLTVVDQGSERGNENSDHHTPVEESEDIHEDRLPSLKRLMSMAELSAKPKTEPSSTNHKDKK